MPQKFTIKSIKLPWEEWDFSQLPPDEGHFCSIYEYAVSTAWFKTSILEWRERAGNRFVAARESVAFMVDYQNALDEANTRRPHSLGHLSELASEFAEGATLAFPFFPEKSWQTLVQDEKRLVQRLISGGPHKSFDEGYYYLTLLLRNFVEQGSLPFSWISGSGESLKAELEKAELHIFCINSGTSRDQLIKAFTDWVDRSGQFPNTHGARRSDAIKNTAGDQLVRLAVKRLMEAHPNVRPLRSLIDAATDRGQLHDWLPKSENRWHDYKRQATAFSEKILPPPPGEIPGA